ncbi:conserved hypothetical protein [Gammaproteobacteria bacterium]
MANVTIRTGAITENDSPEDLPRDKWFTLTGQRRLFVRINITSDCRQLIRFIDEAKRYKMWEATGHTDLDDYIRTGLLIDPAIVGWAIEGLKTMKPDEPIPLEVAVSVGKRAEAAARTVQSVEPLESHGGDQITERLDKAENVKSNSGGNSKEYRAAKLKRDHPEIADRLANGEFKSIREAERAAGMKVPPVLTPLERIQRSISRLTKQEVLVLMEWLLRFHTM